ncbi:outer membrane beta-barrel protein [Undibacterium sp. SXout20W]|uniref:outer membrane beta-barrel protein n=1 Tax=Undibacterium sp. SXout20W TaxID=3413051 RepID=UPI003BF0C386
MLKNKLVIALLATAGLMFSAAASAQVYVGGTAGKAQWSEDCTGLTSCSTGSSAYKLFSGYNINDKFAVEGSYFSLGTIDGNANVPGTQNSYSLKGTGFELAGVYNQAFTDKFSGFAKAGVARIKVANNFVDQNTAGYDSQTSTSPVFGLGVNYKLTNQIALRGEFETRKVKYDGAKEAVNNFSVGLQYSF